MFKWFAHRPALMLCSGLTMGLLVGVGMLIGSLAAVRSQPSTTWPMSETLLHATASHSAETLAMATGWIEQDMEGVFMLDYLTGELQCWVLSSRTAQFVAVFKHNVIADLGVQQGKKPAYVMVTGQAQFLRGAGEVAPANCVLYVADGNTGNFVAYTVLLNRTLYRGNAPQTGIFKLLGTGKARTLEVGQN